MSIPEVPGHRSVGCASQYLPDWEGRISIGFVADAIYDTDSIANPYFIHYPPWQGAPLAANEEYFTYLITVLRPDSQKIVFFCGHFVLSD